MLMRPLYDYETMHDIDPNSSLWIHISASKSGYVFS